MLQRVSGRGNLPNSRSTCVKPLRLLPAFDDPFPRNSSLGRRFLPVADAPAAGSAGEADWPLAAAENGRKAIIESRQEPATPGEVWTSPPGRVRFGLD